MQAIETRYHGPTNYKGARVSARSQGGRVIVHYDDGDGGSRGRESAHARAAKALCSKLGWTWGTMHIGATADGRGYVFVFANLAPSV